MFGRKYALFEKGGVDFGVWWFGGRGGSFSFTQEPEVQIQIQTTNPIRQLGVTWFRCPRICFGVEKKDLAANCEPDQSTSQLFSGSDSSSFFWVAAPLKRPKPKKGFPFFSGVTEQLRSSLVSLWPFMPRQLHPVPDGFPSLMGCEKLSRLVSDGSFFFRALWKSPKTGWQE